MIPQGKLRPWIWPAAVTLGALLGWAVWAALRSPGGGAPSARELMADKEPSDGAASVRGEEVALRYARALQTGAWETVIAMTSWMQDRLAQAALTTSDPGALECARQQLRARLSSREVAGNRLRPEGIEDQYVFAPGTEVAIEGTDDGRASLSEPVLERVWVRVTYPERNRALRDADGTPIHAVSVGVSVGRDGLVLKANVLGNLDIRSESCDYRWPAPTDSGSAASANPNGHVGGRASDQRRGGVPWH